MSLKIRLCTLWLLHVSLMGSYSADLARDFKSPPDSAQPWVYWYFMDGNLSREGMTADLEAMKRAGIGGGIFLEVNIGVPRGKVDFMSPEWQQLLKHGIDEADRLGLGIALGSGPGWCGTGGPWVKPEQSMQHLVASETNVTGPAHFSGKLSRPLPRTPYFGAGTLTPELAKQWREFYQDVAVLAFPKPVGGARIGDIDEKALYYRAPFSSKPGVRPWFFGAASPPEIAKEECVSSERVLDLSGRLKPDGTLDWDVPAGEWTILRFGRTITGQTTRPAPAPGLGFEVDKFDPTALDAHFSAFVEKLLSTVRPAHHTGRGLTTLHFDSWEMSSQNWSSRFREDFRKRRGYDLLPYLPVFTGRVVESREISERFLWDLRQAAQELVIENHAKHLKKLGKKHGLEFSIEPYDMNPCADLELGRVADVPQCEFWSQGYGFATEYSCIEAVSLGHTLGRPVVAAEAFTAEPGEDWKLYPGAMKAQADWALCCGINKFIFHRYQHQPWLDRWPGMTMGPYGVHWERTQTWWDMAPAFHQYLARCQHLLRLGLPVADILYLAPEGSPCVFQPPSSSVEGKLPDRKGYNFDACAPSTLITRASVRDGRICFPDGMSYRLLVLPGFETMTPELLKKVAGLAKAGAWVVGSPPRKSPSLAGYPRCDAVVGGLANELWGTGTEVERRVGKGRVFLSPGVARQSTNTNAPMELYPDYEFTKNILAASGLESDFTGPGLRYIHRKIGKTHIYFVANKQNDKASVSCSFRVTGLQPELWDPVTGECRALPEFVQERGVTSLPLRFEPLQSVFVVFRAPARKPGTNAQPNFRSENEVLAITGPWQVSYDPKWGGPARVDFAELADWTLNNDPGIKYYSGKAIYRKRFDAGAVLSAGPGCKLYLALGEVKNMASMKLNGRELGIVWCAPWWVEVPAGLLQQRGNDLEVTVANLWPNRLIGDQFLEPSKRFCWSTRYPYKKDSPLLPSGLLGPVRLQVAD